MRRLGAAGLGVRSFPPSPSFLPPCHPPRLGPALWLGVRSSECQTHVTESEVQGCSSGQITREKSAILRPGSTCPRAARSLVQDLSFLLLAKGGQVGYFCFKTSAIHCYGS